MSSPQGYRPAHREVASVSKRNIDEELNLVSYLPFDRKAAVEHLCSDIRATHLAELQLCVLTFATGMQNATTFPEYHCFASNQTGNSVLLALSITALFTPKEKHFLTRDEIPPFVPANIGVCLGLFLVGAFVTGQIGHHIVGPLSRPWILFCNLLQSIMVFIAAGLQYKYGLNLHGTTTLIILSLLAFANGSQVVISRSLRMTEISTAMATAAWVDLAVDPGIIVLDNHPRNRRVMFLIALMLGSFAGAVAYVRVGCPFALLMSAVGKLIVTLSFCINPSCTPIGSEKVGCGPQV